MKNPETIIRGIMKEAVMPSSGVEGDYEGDMARGELHAIIAHAQDLLNQIGEKAELEAWVQSKITKAADYISSVHNYMQGQQHRMQSSGMNEQKNEIVKAVAAHVGSKNPKKVRAHFAHDEKAAEEIVKLAKSMEEQVQINELDSATYANYIRKASRDLVTGSINIGAGALASENPELEPHEQEQAKIIAARAGRFVAKRGIGIDQALRLLNKRIGEKNSDTARRIATPSLNEAKSAAWQRKEGKDPEGGLNKKGVESYRRENPGSKLQTAVTTKPSKLKAGSKAAKRRKSFCSRMKGMKAKLTSTKTARDPNSRINKSLRKWNCE